MEIREHFKTLLRIVEHPEVAPEIQMCVKGEYFPRRDNVKTMTTLLEYEGYSVLGNGFFSVVVMHESDEDMVFKLGLKPEDSGAAYAMWARANPGKHVPVIYDIQRYDNVYMVAMKRYSDHPENAFTDDLYYAFKENNYQYLTYEDGSQLEPSFIRTMERIHEFFKGADQLDLHGKNIMLDSDGTIVITDPVSLNTGESKESAMTLERKVERECKRRPMSVQQTVQKQDMAQLEIRVASQIPKFILDSAGWEPEQVPVKPSMDVDVVVQLALMRLNNLISRKLDYHKRKLRVLSDVAQCIHLLGV